MVASSGDNTLHGGAGHDILMGGDGDNMLFGDKGNDDLYDFYGGDVLDGGEGDDIYHIVGGKSASDTGDIIRLRIPTDPTSDPPLAQIAIPTGTVPTTSSVIGTEIVTFTQGDKISFENTEPGCDDPGGPGGDGLAAGELTFDEVTITPPFIAQVVGTMGMICEKNPPNACQTVDFSPANGGC